MNIVVGGLLQESNTFCERAGSLTDFQRYYFLLGEEMCEPQLAENELSGFRKALEEQGATLVPTIYAQAVSSGRIDRHSLNELKQLLLTQLDQIPADCDGVLFALHGAWVAEDNDDADGEIIEAIRLKVGKYVPIVITLDSHANITRRITDHVDALVGYRTFPHIDYTETGYRAANLLFSIIRGEVKPHMEMRKVPMIVPAENHQTYRGPMWELWQEARQAEQRGDALCTSLFAVQPWLDIEEMGFTTVVVGTDEASASAEAERLADLMWSKRKQFDVTLYSVPQILAMLEEHKPDGPVIISDSADSPGAGSPGDSNFVLTRLLEHGAEAKYNCLLSMVDAQAARHAWEAGEGVNVRLTVGYSISNSIGAPIEIEGMVSHAGDGKFRFGGGMVANLEANMGKCAVVRIGGISLLLMENPTFTGDPAMYRSVGLEPTQADLVLVKSANQFRAEYENLSELIFILDTPGASTANLASLPFHNIPRPMYPFDDDFR